MICLQFLTSLLFHRFLMDISCTTSPPQIFLHCQRMLYLFLTAVLPWWEQNWNRWDPCIYYRLVGSRVAESLVQTSSHQMRSSTKCLLSEARGGSEKPQGEMIYLQWEIIMLVGMGWEQEVQRTSSLCEEGQCCQNWARMLQIGLSWAVLFWTVWREAE